MTEPGARSAAPSEPPAAPLVDRFAKALDKLWPERSEPGACLGLAVSGGPDSLAMLLLAQVAIPGRFKVATVDHGLRTEAAGECAMVARLCAVRGIHCDRLKVTVPLGNVQAAAREVRYRALAEWAGKNRVNAIATAHHVEDQAETLLMRLNRASGHSGLGGVRERGTVPGSSLPLIRPLLSFQRSELAGVVAAAGIAPAVDASNSDARYDRVRMRGALSEAGWLDTPAVAASAAHLAEEAEALDWVAEREWREAVRSQDGVIAYRPAAPRAIARRVAARAITAIGKEPRGQDLTRLLEALYEGKGGNIAGVLASVEGGEWIFRREPPRRLG